VLADLAGRSVVVPDASEHVATGACVQAAAALHEKHPDEIAAAWSLGAGTTVEPDARVDADSVRTRYREQVSG
jgi:sugar (pentulose or hexulose) kinase